MPPGLEMNNDLVSPDYDCDAVGWSKNIVIMSPKKEAQDTITNMEDKEEGSKTPDIINEENTPIFINAVSGIFFPICHTQACLENDQREEAILKLFSWQKKFYRFQVVIFNLVILSVIGVIYILVTSVDTFNYNFNVLILFWFKSAFLFLILMGLLTFLLSLDIDLLKLWSSISCCRENRSCETHSSVDVCKQTYVCLLSILLISLPAILGFVFFNISDEQTPVVFFAKRGQKEGQEVVIMGSVVIQDSSVDNVDVVQGGIWSGCTDSPHSEQNILVINITDIKCLDVSAVIKHKSNISSMIILDDSPPLRWRVSSPYTLHNKLETLLSSLPNILVLLVRKKDWADQQEYLKDAQMLAVSRYRDLDWQEINMFSCNFEAGTVAQLVARQVEDEEQSDMDYTYLHQDGRITQDLSFKIICSFHGDKCRWKVEQDHQLAVTCQDITRGHIQPYSPDRNSPLAQTIIKLQNGIRHRYCCKNSHTFVEILSDSEDEVRADILEEDCDFTDFIREDCDRGFGQLKQVRFCMRGTLVISMYTRNLCLTGEVVQNTCDYNQYKC